MQRKGRQRVTTKWLLTWLVLFAAVLSACSSSSDDPVETPTLKMAIFSDPHYYDPELGTTGEAFETYLRQDRKMLAESDAILQAVIDKILETDAPIVLVPGDMTKDGEKICHEKIAQHLAQLEAHGKRVYVVPGNHDILNPHAMRYPEVGDPEPVSSVTATEFETIYAEFGYNEALYRDRASLSYIAALDDHTWLLAIDGCNYGDRFPDLSRTAGRIAEDTMAWVTEKMAEAQSAGITVFGMMHHGIVEHFPNMGLVFADYLIDQWQTVAPQMAMLGVHAFFTGHHHADDIARLDGENSFIIDIETGSTVTWTCPYRILEWRRDLQEMSVTNHLVEAIDYDTQGKAFQTYAFDFLNAGMPDLVVSELQKLGVGASDAAELEPLVTPTLLAYYRGDEPQYRDPELIQAIQELIDGGQPMPAIIGAILLGIWDDPTADRTVLINLETGSIENRF